MFISSLRDENTVGHFQVHISLNFKVRLCKAFVKKIRFQNRTNHHNNNFAHSLALKETEVNWEIIPCKIFMSILALPQIKCFNIFHFEAHHNTAKQKCKKTMIQT